MLKKIEFEGMEFEYDPKEALSYRNIKRISNASSDIAGFFQALEAVFAGKDEEYADMLGGDIEHLSNLFGAVMEAEGKAAKN